MTRLLRLLDGFCFPAAPPARLAVLRIVIGAFALYLTADHFSSWVKTGETSATLFEPVGVVAVLSAPLPPAVFQGMIVGCLVLNAAFVLGWRFRVTGPAFAVVLLWVLTYRNSWSMIYHSANLVVLHVLILGAAPAADALALDAWRRRRAARATMPSAEPDGEDPAGDWRYGWPIRLICAVTAATYVLSGVAKVAGPLGWSWATADGLRSQIAADAIRKEVLGDASSALFYTLYKESWLFAVLAVGSLAAELGAPLALLHRRLGQAWAVAAFAMHWGIFAVMGITFRYQLSGVGFVSFFQPERGANWLSRRIARPRRAAVPTEAANP